MFDEYKKDFEKEKKELVALKETEINNLERKLSEMNNTISQPRLNCRKCEEAWANETQYRYAKCDINFVTQKEFTLHVKSSHPNAVHTCTNCGRNFADNQKLKQHLTSHAKSKGRKCMPAKYIRPYCPRDFNKKRLTEHHALFKHLAD